jgi:hypothetical protein
MKQNIEFEMTNFEKILHSKKIKYTVLDKIFKGKIPTTDLVGNTVNLFIDLYSVFNNLFSPENIDLFYTMNRREKNKFAAQSLNLVGHFRHYFASRHQRYTNIYVYYPTDFCTKKIKINSNFRKDWYEKRINKKNEVFGILAELIQKNLIVAKLIGVYIPHVYFIDTKNIDHLVIPEFIIQESESQNLFNIIYSNENLNLGSVSRYPYTFLLTSKSDASYLISQDNILSEITEAKSLDEFDNFTVKYYFDYIFALGGKKKLNVEPVKGYTIYKAIKTFSKLIKDQNLSYQYVYNYEYIIETLLKNKCIKKEDIETFTKNYELLSTYKTCFDLYKDEKNFLLNQVEDKVDSRSIISLNQEMFSNDPLLLDMLFEGEEY